MYRYIDTHISEDEGGQGAPGHCSPACILAYMQLESHYSK